MDDTKESARQQRWQTTTSELQKALDLWTELSKAPPELTPDEKRLEEIKSLLRKLQSQIDEFTG